MVAIKSNRLFTGIQGPVPDSAIIFLPYWYATVTRSHIPFMSLLLRVIMCMCVFAPGHCDWMNPMSRETFNMCRSPLWSSSHFYVMEEAFLHSILPLAWVPCPSWCPILHLAVTYGCNQGKFHGGSPGPCRRWWVRQRDSRWLWCLLQSV